MSTGNESNPKEAQEGQTSGHCAGYGNMNNNFSRNSYQINNNNNNNNNNYNNNYNFQKRKYPNNNFNNNNNNFNNKGNFNNKFKKFNPKQDHQDFNVKEYYHKSMLDDPWETK